MSKGIFCHAYVEEYYNFYTDPEVCPGPTSMPCTEADDESFGKLENREGLCGSDGHPFNAVQKRMIYHLMREQLKSFHAFANDYRLLPWEMEKAINGSRVDALFSNGWRENGLHLDMYDWKFSSSTGDHAQLINNGREQLRVYQTVCQRQGDIIIDNKWIVVFDPNHRKVFCCIVDVDFTVYKVLIFKKMDVSVLFILQCSLLPPFLA